VKQDAGEQEQSEQGWFGHGEIRFGDIVPAVAYIAVRRPSGQSAYGIGCIGSFKAFFGPAANEENKAFERPG
jgi:hypothetical protein